MSPRALIGAIKGDSLYRNSTYLLINMVSSAAVGFLFWAICAHLYSKENVGYATALLSALALATMASNFGLNRTIVRFLGQSKTRSQDITTKLCLVVAGACLTGIILSFFFRSFGFSHVSMQIVGLFTLTVVAMAVKGIFDNVFVALKDASSTLAENTAFNIIKLCFPIIVVSWGFLGIFATQLAGALAAIVCSVLLLKKKFAYKLRTRPARASLNGKWRFMFGSYATDLVGGLPTNLLPIIVVSKLGAAQGALWYAAMLIVNFLMLISSTVNQAMFAEISNAEHQMGKLIRKSLFVMYGLVIPPTLIVVAFAPQILHVYNTSYVEASSILRLMALFALFGVMNYVTGSILAVYKKVAYLTTVNIINAVIVIVYSYFFATNLTGIVVGWVIGEIVNLILFVGGAYVVVKQERARRVQAAEKTKD